MWLWEDAAPGIPLMTCCSCPPSPSWGKMLEVCLFIVQFGYVGLNLVNDEQCALQLSYLFTYFF